MRLISLKLTNYRNCKDLFLSFDKTKILIIGKNAQGKTNILEEDFEKELYTSSLPPLDFVIRTGGEQRISNFMLWQIAYAEFYFPKYFWPSFNERKLKQCCKEFAKRDRRFGNIR